MTSDTITRQGLVPLDEYDDLLSRMTEMESQRNHYRKREEWASDLLRRAASENEAVKVELAELRRLVRQLVDDVTGGYDVLALDDIDQLRVLVALAGSEGGA
jgi:hypothetical protein